ncbi:MAG: class I SAM-dependent methyltransferase [Chloroflexi bacterium]|jgi:arsenite methyltransferase|nr:class I SAM-dependent methyltransferase [Anaerolineaceae bacterium]NMB89371.1 class I SAM-dependent methyltransferase [Chloroflexota bacterium]
MLERSPETNRLYEKAEVQHALGDALRPGGLALTRRALAFSRLPRGAGVLDLGCGTGATLHYLRDQGYRAQGMDLSAALLRKAHLLDPGLPLARADAARLPLSGDHCDAVLVECSLSVFAEPKRALAEIRRLLRPRGLFILSDLYARDPDKIDALRALPAGCCFQGTLSKDLVLKWLADLDFEILVWEDHSDLLKNLGWQMIGIPGVLEQYRANANNSSLDALDLQLAILRARPGFFLLIARKRV